MKKLKIFLDKLKYVNQMLVKEPTNSKNKLKEPHVEAWGLGYNITYNHVQKYIT